MKTSDEQVKILMDKTYYGGEDLVDIGEHVWEAIEDAQDLPTEHGIVQGAFKVTIVWSEE